MRLKILNLKSSFSYLSNISFSERITIEYSLSSLSANLIFNSTSGGLQVLSPINDVSLGPVPFLYILSYNSPQISVK